MKRSTSAVEPLEARIAPAMASLAIVSDHKATYTDIDGDHVTVTNTKGVLTAALFSGVASGMGDQWQMLDLSAGGFDGTALTVTVAKIAGGDGLASLGYLNSTNHPLGAVKIQGDLTRLDAGIGATPEALTGVTALDVHSMGIFGIATQASGGTINSKVNGTLGSLKIAGDMSGFLSVTHKIGTITIGGDLQGTALANSGRIVAFKFAFPDAEIGTVTIAGSILGGAGQFSGCLEVGGKMGKVTIGGDIVGGGPDSGFIQAGGAGFQATSGNVQSLTVKGAVSGGSSSGAGFISINGTCGTLTLGAVAGGSAGSGRVEVFGDTKVVNILGDVSGKAGGSSGYLALYSHNGTVKVGGSIIGGANTGDGTVLIGVSVTSLTVGGDVVAGTDPASGAIFAGDPNANPQSLATVGTITIAGSVLGNGSIYAAHNGLDITGRVKLITVGHDVQGALVHVSAGLDNLKVAGNVTDAAVQADGNLGPVTIGGSLVKAGVTAKGQFTSIHIHGDISGNIRSLAALGSVFIGGSLVPSDTVANLGSIDCAGTMGKLTIVGSVHGLGTGQIRAGTLTSVQIGHDFYGGIFADHVVSVTIGGSVSGAEKEGTIQSTSGDIDSITIGGSLAGDQNRAFPANNTGVISAQGHLGKLMIGGDFLGGAGSTSGVIFAGAGGIGSIMIVGSMVGADSASPGASAQVADRTNEGIISTNGDIGSIRIGGDLTGGSLFNDKQLNGSGSIFGGHVGSISVGGSIVTGRRVTGTGTLLNNASIHVQSLGSLTVGGSLVGHAGVPLFITAQGQDQPVSADVAIGKITIGHDVTLTSVDAGYTDAITPRNGDAQIGAVTVGGSWTQSNLLAGVENTASGGSNFGDANDTAITATGRADLFSKIASITIKGSVHGSVGAGDHYGFSAQEIGALKIGATIYHLTAGRTGDVIELSPATGDFTAREVP